MGKGRSKSPKFFSSDELVREEVLITPNKYTIGSREIRHFDNPKPEIMKVNGNPPNF